MRRALVLLSLCVAGCLNSFDPASFLVGLRVIGVKAEPPQIGAGQMSLLHAIVVDDRAADAGVAGTIHYAWATCTQPPISGTGGAVNPDCIKDAPQPYLHPFGDDSPDATVTMEHLVPQLDQLDETDGLYLPVVLRVDDGVQTVFAVERVRIQLSVDDLMQLFNALPKVDLGATGTDLGAATADLGAPDQTSACFDAAKAALLFTPNHNPTLAHVFVPSDLDGGAPLDAGVGEIPELVEGTPKIVHAKDKITLRAETAGAETYAFLDLASSPPCLSTDLELLPVNWYASAGELSHDTTGGTTPDTVLNLDKHLPPSGTLIDLYAVVRDGRGGLDYAHRTLQFQ